MDESDQDTDRAQRATAALATTRFRSVSWVATTGSTNADLIDAVRAGAAPGLVRVADHQTAGRGRRDRRWETAPGDALLMSMVLGFGDEMTAAAVATTVVATSTVEVLRELGFGDVSVKWPNDLVVGEPGGQRKLAGVLAQAERRGDLVAVVAGIGCNVIGDRLEAPGAVALSDIGDAPDRFQLMVRILLRVDAWLVRVEAGGAEELRERWCALSSTLGSRVQVDLGDRVIEGRAATVSTAGALIIETDDGATIEVVVGDVVSLRSSCPGATGSVPPGSNVWRHG